MDAVVSGRRCDHIIFSLKKYDLKAFGFLFQAFQYYTEIFVKSVQLQQDGFAETPNITEWNVLSKCRVIQFH